LTTTTPPCTARCRCRLLVHQLRHYYPRTAHRRSPSRLGIAGKRSTLPTNWKSTSNFLPKTSTPATQFSGGWADGASFRASFSWRAMFYAFRGLLSPLKGYFRVGGTPFLSDALAFTLTQSGPLCLSRSGSTSFVPGPMPPSSVRGTRCTLCHSLLGPPHAARAPISYLESRSLVVTACRGVGNACI
jgi:hypothetical protein